jgi:glycosyltransferase involved in cell wall biosynthesis
VPLSIPLAQRRDRLALWHGSWVSPPWNQAPLVLTVHDVLFATRPKLFAALQGARLRATVRLALRRAQRVLVPTDATRQALLGAYPFVDPRTVDLVPLAVDPRVFSPEPGGDETERREALVGSTPYVLAVGRPHPRKNLPTLMTALAKLSGLDLVLAGPHERATTSLREQARAAGLDPRRLKVVERPSDSDLAILYRGCAAFCFPSLAEGFGLPALEAMACGAATVVSTDPALVEVCGDAARTVPPLDARGFAEAIDTATGDETARARGIERAAGFTLEALARGTLATYAKVLGF